MMIVRGVQTSFDQRVELRVLPYEQDRSTQHDVAARTLQPATGMKRIADLMTPQPWTVQLDDSLAVARQMLVEREIHHLPVLDGGNVVGMVTERDLSHMANRLGTVADVVVPATTVAADTALDNALDVMATNRSDAVIVTNEGTVEGIFTASDAVRELRDILRRRRARA